MIDARAQADRRVTGPTAALDVCSDLAAAHDKIANMNTSCQEMDALGIYMEFPSKLDPFMNDDMKDLWDSDLDQV